MSDSEITIFYSWQSDLPGSDTRNIIQDSIKDAIRLLRNTVDIEADRDTKGEYGSPDIAQTIFSKIDACDIFIADVSAVCQYEVIDNKGERKKKYMPNSNVMLELGYAAHAVGWNNVICILNSDYGSPENMPFDIASRRLTPFSLKDGKSKGEVKRYIKDVIQDTIKNILENGKRVKTGFSDLRIGCFENGSFVNLLNSIVISQSPSFVRYKEQILEECLKLIEKIKSIKITDLSKSQSEKEINNPVEEENETVIIRKDGSMMTPIKNSFKNLFQQHRVIISDDEKENIIELIKYYLGIDLSAEKEFFYFGDLEEKTDLSKSISYEGTDEEKTKYKMLIKLEYKLHYVKMLCGYVKTFDGMLFIPLAIENVSEVYDEDIDVHIKLKEGAADVVSPSKKLINPDVQRSEELILEDGVIKALLMMPESSSISYDTDISYNIEDNFAKARAVMETQFSIYKVNEKCRYTADDYEREISKYIATPTSTGEFVFFIKSLRAKERKWLGPALLIKPLLSDFDIEYSIKSKHSDGNLSGIVKYDADLRNAI